MKQHSYLTLRDISHVDERVRNSYYVSRLIHNTGYMLIFIFLDHAGDHDRGLGNVPHCDSSLFDVGTVIESGHAYLLCLGPYFGFWGARTLVYHSHQTPYHTLRESRGVCLIFGNAAWLLGPLYQRIRPGYDET